MAALHPFLVGNRSPNPWPWRIIRPTKTAARPSLKEFYWTGSNMVLKMCSNKIHTRFFAMTSFLFKDVNSIQRVLSLPVFVLSMFHCFFGGNQQDIIFAYIFALHQHSVECLPTVNPASWWSPATQLSTLTGSTRATWCGAFWALISARFGAVRFGAAGGWWEKNPTTIDLRDNIQLTSHLWQRNNHLSN